MPIAGSLRILKLTSMTALQRRRLTLSTLIRLCPLRNANGRPAINRHSRIRAMGRA
jgi:hypothetical protein